MRFLVDMNLPPALAELLCAEGHDAIHALAAGCDHSPDLEIFNQAAADHRTIITFDLDFGEIAAAAALAGPSVILLRLRTAHLSYLWVRLKVAIAQAGEKIEAGGVIALVEDLRIRIRQMPPSD